METPRDQILAMLLPGAIALLLFAIAWRPWRRNDPVQRGHWAAPIAFGLSAAIVMAGLQRYWLLPGVDAGDAIAFPPVPPVNRMLWLMLLALPLGLVGLIDALVWPSRWWMRGPLALLVLVGFFRLLLSRLEWGDAVLCAGITWGVWALLEPLAMRLRNVVVPVTIWVAAVATSMMLIHGTSPVLGKTAGAIASVAGAAAVFAIIGRGNVSLARGGAFVALALLGGILAWGHFYADVRVVTAPRAIAAVALPLLGWTFYAPFIRKWRPAWRIGATLAILFIAAGIVAGPAVMGVVELVRSQATGPTPGGYPAYGY
ncbi:MAG TPA: hypothetical protein VGN72_11265 [Tepidisphaeraceae bacterium]|jgi:hypothetical protein|nr:hypothetical protein [Tepidisphaeraceae bacterium]